MYTYIYIYDIYIYIYMSIDILLLYIIIIIYIYIYINYHLCIYLFFKIKGVSAVLAYYQERPLWLREKVSFLKTNKQSDHIERYKFKTKFDRSLINNQLSSKILKYL